jgi:hypothetical protein
MKFYSRKFDTPSFTLFPLGDFHYGSRQCDVDFIKQVVERVRTTKNAYWCGMGDFLENAIVGSKSDTYLQTVPPREQLHAVVDLLRPIQDKGLFLIAGNHEQRSMRAVGMMPEDFLAVELKLPYMGYSCMAYLQTKSPKSPHGFSIFTHHNYGGGYTPGGKVNRADAMRRIAPTVDAAFSGHFHITGRNPVTWYENGDKSILKKTGYNYITGSALTWNESYAEEKCKPPASLEFISVEFIGGTRGDVDNRQQIYRVIGKE